MLQIRRANDRGVADFGWLKSRHTFSFGHYHDAKQQGFSDLLVINDDRVHPGRGFGTHPHRDMEIFSYVLEGALEHKDSMGTGSIIRPGDVQMMSAGTGVRHSEFNPSASDPLHFLQIWIVPDAKGVAPRYQQVHFAPEDKRGKLRLIISPEGTDGSLAVHQNARVYAGLFDGAESASDPLHFLQIWIVPDVKGVAPRYQQVHFAPEDKRGKLRLIISPEGTDGSLAVHQNARVYAGLFDGAESASLTLGPDRYAYVHVARGSVEVNGERLSEGDGARVRSEQQLRLAAGTDAEVLVFDLQPHELPDF